MYHLSSKLPVSPGQSSRLVCKGQSPFCSSESAISPCEACLDLRGASSVISSHKKLLQNGYFDFKFNIIYIIIRPQPRVITYPVAPRLARLYLPIMNLNSTIFIISVMMTHCI